MLLTPGMFSGILIMMERLAYLAGENIQVRRRNCLIHILNTAIDRGDLEPVDARDLYGEVADSGQLESPLPPGAVASDPWLGIRDPCQDQ